MFKLSMEGSVKEGILTITGGPNFESIAELKLFQMAGADAVGRHFFCHTLCLRLENRDIKT